MDPPSTDPAADLGRTVLAIIEGTVADRLRLLRTIYVTSLWLRLLFTLPLVQTALLKQSHSVCPFKQPRTPFQIMRCAKSKGP